MVSGATTGQQQSAGREYKADGSFHGIVFNTESCAWFRLTSQLNDGGPPATPESPTDVAGPTFVAALWLAAL